MSSVIELVDGMLLEETSTLTVLRVVGVRPDLVALIEVQRPGALPKVHARSEVEKRLAKGELLVTDIDPFDPKRVNPEELAVPARERFEARKAVINEMMDPRLETVFFSDERGQAARRVMAENKELGQGLTSLRAINAAFSSYLRAGKRIDALAEPGRYGDRKPQNGGMKRGRRSMREVKFGNRLGVPKTDAHVKRVVDGYKEFHVKKRQTLMKAYRHTLAKHYGKRVRLADGQVEVVLEDADAVPSFWQFCRWAREKVSRSQRLLGQRGEIGYQASDRSRELKIEQRYDSPGRFEIDWTVLNVWLVSSLGRIALGPAILYFVIDSFSRMVMGFSLTWRHASWETAMDALLNAFLPKKPFLDSIGLVRPEGAWPAHYVCSQLVTDNGEIATHAGQCLPDMNIDLVTLPAYRGDFKPVVESRFGALEKSEFSSFEGAMPSRKVYTERDFRKSAIFTPDEMYQEIADLVLYYNQNHVIEGYVPTSGMVEDHICAIPQKLLEWAIPNRSGLLMVRSPSYLRKALLRPGIGQINKRGLMYEGLVFRPEATDITELRDWAAQRRNRRVPVRADRRRLDWIYMDGPHGLEECLVDGLVPVKGLSWGEYDAYVQQRAEELAAGEAARLQAGVALAGRQQAREKAARARTSALAKGRSGRSARVESGTAASRADASDGSNEHSRDPWAGRFTSSLPSPGDDEEEE